MSLRSSPGPQKSFWGCQKLWLIAPIVVHVVKNPLSYSVTFLPPSRSYPWNPTFLARSFMFGQLWQLKHVIVHHILSFKGAKKIVCRTVCVHKYTHHSFIHAVIQRTMVEKFLVSLFMDWWSSPKQCNWPKFGLNLTRCANAALPQGSHLLRSPTDFSGTRAMIEVHQALEMGWNGDGLRRNTKVGLIFWDIICLPKYSWVAPKMEELFGSIWLFWWGI